MGGDIEISNCKVCGKVGVPVQRTYFRYDINCRCHSPSHFEMVQHCAGCIPQEPKETKVVLETSSLKKL